MRTMMAAAVIAAMAGTAKADRAADCEAIRQMIVQGGKALGSAVVLTDMAGKTKGKIKDAGGEVPDTPALNRWFLEMNVHSIVIIAGAEAADLGAAVKALGRICYGK